mgnify:CR=1 FL=1
MKFIGVLMIAYPVAGVLLSVIVGVVKDYGPDEKWPWLYGFAWAIPFIAWIMVAMWLTIG